MLDLDDAGPFSATTRSSRSRPIAAPLAGLDVVFDHRRYNWDEPAPLGVLLRELGMADAIVAASSEGGLFEYGSDDAIVANLEALRAANVKLVAGSVTSSDEAPRRNITASRFKLIPRGLQGFAPLAARARLPIAQAETAQLSDQVLLRPA